MLITITQFLRVARDENGAELPMGDGFKAGAERTSAGAFSALHGDTKLVRIATDTAVKLGGLYSGHSPLLMPGESWFKVAGGDTLTVTELS